jgi:hypothetical protein
MMKAGAKPETPETFPPDLFDPEPCLLGTSSRARAAYYSRRPPPRRYNGGRGAAQARVAGPVFLIVIVFTRRPPQARRSARGLASPPNVSGRHGFAFFPSGETLDPPRDIGRVGHRPARPNERRPQAAAFFPSKSP